MNEICYYDSLKKELKGSIFSKARKLNKLKCVEQVTDNLFQVKPIKNYNVTTYIVENKNGNWECNCQAFTQENKICSHLCAVSLYLKNKKGEGIEIEEN